MKLAVQLSGPDGASERHILREGSLVIGRAPDCGLVLVDPERTLSNRHCVVTAEHGAWTITDTSTNGVFLGNADEPLGRGQSAVLSSGDVAHLGAYTLAFSFLPAETRATVDGGGDPRVGFNIPMHAPSEAPAKPLPFGRASGPIDGKPEEPWLEQIDSGAFGHGMVPNRQGWDAPPEPDALAATGVLSILSPPPEAERADTAFQDLSEHLPASATTMRIPPASRVLPLDWDQPEGAVPAPADRVAVSPEVPSTPVVEWAAPVESPPAPLAAILVEPPAAEAAKAPDRSPSSEVDLDAMLRAFVAGAGLSPTALAGQDPLTVMRNAGAIVRCAVDGIRDILSTRALVKSELRVEHTMIRPSDNNTLKFVPDSQSCVVALLGNPPPGFMQGPACMQQSVDDIKRHELAMIAAISGAVEDLLARLDPEKIRIAGDEDPGIGAFIPSQKKARYWQIYERRYRELRETQGDPASRAVLGPMATAYARQISRVS